MDNNFDSDILINKAIFRLDEELSNLNVIPFDLKVVGGYALILSGLRQKNQITDVDYVGESFSQEVNRIINEIGREFHLGNNWINNDVLLTGESIDSLADCVGVYLKFKKAFELNVITVYRLDEHGLLAMKLNAIDTSLIGTEFQGKFTRMKDFEDIVNLKKRLGYSYEYLENMIDWLSGEYGIKMIKAWEKNQERGVNQVIEEYNKDVIDIYV